ncbi:hypothetical protein JTB14_004886 [Gonioctena quinquepunctata]|nr:hypothetical protein JTB14_004886 [Gonioctena quinquepunctata]
MKDCQNKYNPRGRWTDKILGQMQRSPTPSGLKSMHQPCNMIPLDIQIDQTTYTTGFNINTIQMYGTTYKR